MKWRFNPYFVSIWIVINALNIAWWILYVVGFANPSPHSTGVIGIFPLRTLIILGFFSVMFNMFPAFWYIRGMQKYQKDVGRPAREKRSFDINPWLVYPFWGILLSLPLALFLGGYGAAVYSWDHRCSSYPLYAILSATKTHDITTSRPIAQFYQTGDKPVLFTYNLTGNLNSDSWGFGIEEWDTIQSKIPLQLQPALQKISYNSTNSTLNGSCIVSTEGSNTTELVPCLTGTFTRNDFLAFNLTSTTPSSNTTITNKLSQSSSSPEISLRSSDRQWQFDITAAPYVILHQYVANLKRFSKVVLRTAVPNPSDCTQLKVCISGDGQGSVASAEVLASLGVILMGQARYASSCIDFGEST